MNFSLKLIRSIRKTGWPDKQGDWNYGNAAVLSFLNSVEAGTASAKQFFQMPAKKLIEKWA